MANRDFINKFPRHLATTYYDLRRKTSKLQRTAASIGFIRNALHNDVTPTFAKVTGNINNENLRKKAEKNNLRAELNEHCTNIQSLSTEINNTQLNICTKYGDKIHKLLNSHLLPIEDVPVETSDCISRLCNLIANHFCV